MLLCWWHGLLLVQATEEAAGMHIPGMQLANPARCSSSCTHRRHFSMLLLKSRRRPPTFAHLARKLCILAHCVCWRRAPAFSSASLLLKLVLARGSKSVVEVESIEHWTSVGRSRARELLSAQVVCSQKARGIAHHAPYFFAPHTQLGKPIFLGSN